MSIELKLLIILLVLSNFYYQTFGIIKLLLSNFSSMTFCQIDQILIITRAMQSVAYPLAYKFDPVTLTLTFDLENQ
jgi:hypothetical protein